MNLTEFLRARIAEDEAAILSPHGVNAHRDRMRAECEAKKEIVKAKVLQTSAALAVRDETLRYLALPYAEHPDYREEWKP